VPRWCDRFGQYGIKLGEVLGRRKAAPGKHLLRGARLDRVLSKMGEASLRLHYYNRGLAVYVPTRGMPATTGTPSIAPPHASHDAAMGVATAMGVDIATAASASAATPSRQRRAASAPHSSPS